jgi:hypothetical protein
MKMNRVILILVLFVVIGLISRLAVAAEKDKPTPLPTVAEKIQKGEIDVGGKANKAFGMGQDQRFHRIHNKVLGLECGTCHVNKVPLSTEIFTLRPAVDASAQAPGIVDRRVCLGCHTAGPGRDIYGPKKP